MGLGRNYVLPETVVSRPDWAWQALLDVIWSVGRRLRACGLWLHAPSGSRPSGFDPWRLRQMGCLRASLAVRLFFEGREVVGNYDVGAAWKKFSQFEREYLSSTLSTSTSLHRMRQISFWRTALAIANRTMRPIGISKVRLSSKWRSSRLISSRVGDGLVDGICRPGRDVRAQHGPSLPARLSRPRRGLQPLA